MDARIWRDIFPKTRDGEADFLRREKEDACINILATFWSRPMGLRKAFVAFRQRAEVIAVRHVNP